MGTVLGLDDTDSREGGMCTTYVGASVADALVASGHAVEGRRLVRLNPAIEYKTRGNAAVAIETEAPPAVALDLARERVEALAVAADPATNPGVVAVDADRAGALAALTWRAIRNVVPIAAAREALESVDARTASLGSGRGLVGAAAAVGAGVALDEWTVELLAYREPERWGTPRDVDDDTVVVAAERTYPLTWDTVDRTVGEAVCVPNAPGPVLFGLRGETPAAVRSAAAAMEHEPVERRALFATNQGTDQHLRPAAVGSTADGGAYAVSARVVEPSTTRPGGHVHLTVGAGGDRLPCVAFEPTGRFRDRVRGLRVGDRVTVCGEVADGTLKLEKFALRRPVRHRRVVPRCPTCDRSMESAGAGQGYRCRRCDTVASRKRVVALERDLDVGWYEVPPVARRHVAKPLVRGGFDAPVHPER
ncbi:MAG: DUF1743 domain-containing protein [Halobacteriales archaeon]